MIIVFWLLGLELVLGKHLFKFLAGYHLNLLMKLVRIEIFSYVFSHRRIQDGKGAHTKPSSSSLPGLWVCCGSCSITIGFGGISYNHYLSHEELAYVYYRALAQVPTKSISANILILKCPDDNITAEWLPRLQIAARVLREDGSMLSTPMPSNMLDVLFQSETGVVPVTRVHAHPTLVGVD